MAFRDMDPTPDYIKERLEGQITWIVKRLEKLIEKIDDEKVRKMLRDEIDQINIEINNDSSNTSSWLKEIKIEDYLPEYVNKSSEILKNQ